MTLKQLVSHKKGSAGEPFFKYLWEELYKIHGQMKKKKFNEGITFEWLFRLYCNYFHSSCVYLIWMHFIDSYVILQVEMQFLWIRAWRLVRMKLAFIQRNTSNITICSTVRISNEVNNSTTVIQHPDSTDYDANYTIITSKYRLCKGHARYWKPRLILHPIKYAHRFAVLRVVFYRMILGELWYIYGGCFKIT